MRSAYQAEVIVTEEGDEVGGRAEALGVDRCEAHGFDDGGEEDGGGRSTRRCRRSTLAR